MAKEANSSPPLAEKPPAPPGPPKRYCEPHSTFREVCPDCLLLSLSKLAGEFLGTDPEYQGPGGIEAALGYAKTLRDERREDYDLAREVLGDAPRSHPQVIRAAFEYAKRLREELSLVAPLLTELRRAEAKFPTWPTDIIHAVAVMAEEAGETTKASLDCFYSGAPISELKGEVIQTGAMCLRILKNLPKEE